MNTILTDLIEERKGRYCHCIEASSVEELKETLYSIFDEFNERYSQNEITDFLYSLEIYFLEDESLSCDENLRNESLLYEFSIREFVLEELVNR